MRIMSDQEYAEQEYMPPKNYFEPDASEMKVLQSEAGDLRADIDNKSTSWVDRTRASTRLGEVERLIQTGRAAAKQTTVGHTSREATQRRVKEAAAAVEKARAAAGLETLHTDLPRSPVRANNSEGRWVQADGGDRWLWIPWDAKQKAAVANVTEPKTPEDELFAPPVPYFAAQ